MGTFVSASGVIGADHEAVERSLTSHVTRHGGVFERYLALPDRHIAVITEGGPNTTILWPREINDWDSLSQHLSQELEVPVFSFHIHDGDLWMFVLYHRGEEVTQFNTMPDYWEELAPEEKASWAGDAQAICRQIPGLSPDSIKNYLVEWTEAITNSGTKAYPDDECYYGDEWQMTDFMNRLGLRYPLSATGHPDGKTYKFRLR
ncbi:MAG: hypothetical protein ACRC8S_19855 [Fimbriiglobus sp.]